MTFRNAFATGLIVAITGCFSAVHLLKAATPATTATITYTASGTFATTPSSGSDTLRLAGEPFSVIITVSASTPPYKHGSNWAAYNKLKLTGSVHSGLLGPTPVNIASNQANIIQAIAPNQYDMFTMEAPVQVVGINLTIKAPIVLPWGTIANQLLHPFTAVSLAPGNASMSYADGTNTTVIPVQSGTLTATAQ